MDLVNHGWIENIIVYNMYTSNIKLLFMIFLFHVFGVFPGHLQQQPPCKICFQSLLYDTTFSE